MRQILILGLLFFVNSCIFGQKLTVAEAQEDILFFRKKMAAWYPGIGYYQPREKYEKTLDSIAISITQPIDYQDFYQKLAPIRGVLQDGHFGINHRKNMPAKTGKYVPFFIRKAEEKYFISHDLTVDSSLRRGTEILKINGQSVAEIHQFLTKKYRDGNDGPTDIGAAARIQLSFAGYFADWFGQPDSIEMSFKTTDSSEVLNRKIACETLAARDNIFIKRYGKESKARPHLSFIVVDSIPNTAILTISTFSKTRKRDVLNLEFQRKIKKAFAEAEEKGIENLVIDLRNNGGGAVINCSRLLRYLIPKRFDVFNNGHLKRRAIWPYSWKVGPFGFLFFFTEHRRDRENGGWRDRKHKKAGEKPRKKHHFDKNVYFLINGVSYSAAVSVPSIARSHDIGTFVGEATGGAYWGDFAARFQNIKLPNSKIRVRIPLKKIDHAVDLSKNKTILVEPDFPVERKIADVMAARDFMTPFVLDLIKKGIKK
jgi:Peptidase family S41